MNFNFSRSGVKTLITSNPKTVFWSSVGTLVLTTISVKGSIWLYKRKMKCETKAHIAKSVNDGEIAIKKMQVGTDSDLVKAIQDGEIAIRKKRVDTECDILATTAHTACKMMEQATAVAPELRCLKDNILAVKEELKAMKEELSKVNIPIPSGEPSSDDSSIIDCNGHSSAELFNRAHEDNSKWIVDGYMKVGMVNLLVAGGGVGKSNLMTQIALAVDKGTRPEFLPPECHASAKLRVKYYRLEDFSDELEGKYGDGWVLKQSGIEWFLPKDLPDNNLKGFINHLKALAATLTEDTLVCIDPATKLDGYKHAEFIKGVEEAMEIAKARNLTFTPVASIHLDEIEDWKYLSLNNIKGGDKALQLAGSVTALRRERTNGDYRFLQCLKEPKGSPKPFNGDVLVCKAVEDEDGNSKYLHYEFDSIKPEVKARPIKPKVQESKTSSMVSEASITPHAPNQKITPEIDKIIQEDLGKNMKVKEIVKDIKKRTKVVLSVDYLRKYINSKK